MSSSINTKELTQVLDMRAGKNPKSRMNSDLVTIPNGDPFQREQLISKSQKNTERDDVESRLFPNIIEESKGFDLAKEQKIQGVIKYGKKEAT